MPRYQYACTACGEELEVVQSFADEPLTQCPSCSGRLRKVFSPVGVVFKGSGFYKTDSRGRTAARAPAGDDTGDKGGKGEKAAAGADSAASASPSSAPSPAEGSDGSSTGSTTSSRPAGGSSTAKSA